MTRFALLIALFAMFVSPLAAEPSFKCLLVSIEKYELAPLDFADNDVGQFANILMQRYDCEARACVDSAALSSESGADAAKRSIMRRIETWCKSIGSEDNALLYLAGHGVKDDAGKLYLAMINFDRKNFDAAAIPLEWIREQFGKSRGKNKMLLIDTCFAGTAKSIDFEQAASDEMSGSFADLQNVVTIASCRGNEKSWIWGDAKHSLFTYWIIEAFKGHADLDGDMVVTCDEIVSYLQENVPWVAKTALEKEQNPVVLNDAAGANFKLPLRAVALSRLIDDVAEQIDLQMRMENFDRIGIPEFSTGANQTFDRSYGALPRSVADDLRNKLAAKARKNKSGYAVLSENALREALQSKGITPSDLGTEKTAGMKVGGADIPLIVDGRILMFGTAGLSLRVNLLDTKGTSAVGKAGGVALLSQNDLAMSGISAKFAISQPSPPPSTTLRQEPGVGLVSPQQIASVERMRESAVLLHPLDNAASSSTANKYFDVWIETRSAGSNGGYTKRPFEFRGNDCYLPISKGEEYQVNFKVDLIPNLPGEVVFVRVLVDGLNTLSQKRTTVAKGVYVEAADPDAGGEYVIAPRVTLGNARPWVVVKDGFGKALSVMGFVDANGTNDTLRRFRIVDADESVISRKDYTEQLGLITVAFYQAAPPVIPGSRRLIVTDPSAQEEVIDVTDYEGKEIPGDLLAVYNIRYLTPEALKELPK